MKNLEIAFTHYATNEYKKTGYKLKKDILQLKNFMLQTKKLYLQIKNLINITDVPFYTLQRK